MAIYFLLFCFVLIVGKIAQSNQKRKRTKNDQESRHLVLDQVQGAGNIPQGAQNLGHDLDPEVEMVLEKNIKSQENFHQKSRENEVDQIQVDLEHRLNLTVQDQGLETDLVLYQHLDPHLDLNQRVVDLLHHRQDLVQDQGRIHFASVFLT